MEQVNHPQHYTVNGRKECIVEMEEKYGPMLVINFSLGNAYKYLYRAGNKNDNPKQQDLDKALWYFNKTNQVINENDCDFIRDTDLYLDVEKELLEHELL